MGRLVKHIGARTAASDDSAVLMAVPYFPGERITNWRIDGYFASGADSAIDQPGEINWYGISIPWSLVWATDLLNAGTTPGLLGGVPAFDTLFAQWLKDVNDSEAGEIYGGDVDIDPETISGEEAHGSEELLDSGPIGVHKFFSREALMRPFAAEGNTVIRFGDSFTSQVSVPASKMGGLCLFGVVRFAPTAQTEFNIELDDATSREMAGLLIAGDYTKVKAKIEGDTAATGDWLRTVLFGGDQYVEADTLKGPTGKAIVKSSIYIDSPISRLG